MNSLSIGRHWRAIFAMLALVSSICLSQVAQAQSNRSCGDLSNAYGPFDFRVDKDKLPIVISMHFKPEVEALIRGITSSRPGPDIDYTLRAIPNHPGALLAMVRLGVKEKTDMPSGVRYTVECWLERALRFRPDDNLARLIYANYLGERQRKPDALKQLQAVAANAAENPFTHYNLGMIYADLKEFESALKHAHIAMELGIRQTALQDKLKSAGQWKDAPIAPSSAAAASEPPLAASSAASQAAQ